jgi:hypothetical protein
MIEIIEVECYFVVLNFSRLVLMRILSDIFNIFHVIYKMYCSFEVLHTILSVREQWLRDIAWPFTIYKYY